MPRELLSQTPGGADGEDALPSNRALFVADLNGDGIISFSEFKTLMANN